MKKSVLKPGKLIADAALKVTEVGANSACIFILYQAKLPQNAKKLRKF